MSRSKKGMLFLLFFASTWGVACSVSPPQADAAARLHTATKLTSETQALISAILLDITNREGHFGAADRREALDAIPRLQAHEFIPTVRQIAAMPLEGSDRTRHPEVVAISSALRILADLGDGAAPTLNKQRLHDESLRGFAIQNLRILRAWKATDAVQAELLRMQMSNANGREVVAMLDFLVASPETSEKVCAALDRVTAAYPDCERADGTLAPSFCVDLALRRGELRAAKCISPQGQSATGADFHCLPRAMATM